VNPSRCPVCGRPVRRPLERITLEPRCRRCIAAPPKNNPPTKWRREGAYFIAEPDTEPRPMTREAFVEARECFFRLLQSEPYPAG
jgi:hypothetical protein